MSPIGTLARSAFGPNSKVTASEGAAQDISYHGRRAGIACVPRDRREPQRRALREFRFLGDESRGHRRCQHALHVASHAATCRAPGLMQSRLRQLAAGLAVLQIADAIASATPQMSMAGRLDHLGVPGVLRPALPMIKVSTSAGLLVGLRQPWVGAAASAVLVAFYAAAVGFHGFAGDHAAVALPATAFGASAALCLVVYFIPVMEVGTIA